MIFPSLILPANPTMAKEAATHLLLSSDSHLNPDLSALALLNFLRQGLPSETLQSFSELVMAGLLSPDRTPLVPYVEAGSHGW